jgi:hypothetical protein
MVQVKSLPKEDSKTQNMIASGSLPITARYIFFEMAGPSLRELIICVVFVFS